MSQKIKMYGSAFMGESACVAASKCGALQDQG
jgi:hypothetical protein